MNYIKHLNQWMELVAVDDRLSPHHISIYLALFQLWNKNRFPQHMSICRQEVLSISKVGSSKTYYKCLHDLDDFGYLVYQPSCNPLKGSIISISDLGDGNPLDEDDSEKDNDSDDDLSSPEETGRYPAPTRVAPEKNMHSFCSKNDSGGNHVVTPFYINRLNFINDKQKTRRAQEKKIKIDDGLKSTIPLRYCHSESLMSDGKGCQPLKSDHQKNRVESQTKKLLRENFSVPRLEDVKDFFSGLPQVPLGLDLDRRAMEMEAVKFFHHFESNGWLVGGKAPMKNWKAACTSWAVKIPFYARKTSPPPAERKNYHVNQHKHYAQPL